MSVVTSVELAAYLGVDEPTYRTALNKAILSAELVVASELGALSLDDDSSEDTVEIKTARNIVEIKNGILTAVTALTINGDAADLDDVQTSYWVVAYTEGFTRGDVVVISYDHGYADSSEMPPRLFEAVLQTAEWMYNGEHQGGQKSSEKLGDYAVSYNVNAGTFTIPDVPRKLIQEFARAPA